MTVGESEGRRKARHSHLKSAKPGAIAEGVAMEQIGWGGVGSL